MCNDLAKAMKALDGKKESPVLDPRAKETCLKRGQKVPVQKWCPVEGPVLAPSVWQICWSVCFKLADLSSNSSCVDKVVFTYSSSFHSQPLLLKSASTLQQICHNERAKTGPAREHHFWFQEGSLSEFFFRPTPSWLSPGRYTHSIAAKRWIVNYNARPSKRR